MCRPNLPVTDGQNKWVARLGAPQSAPAVSVANDADFGGEEGQDPFVSWYITISTVTKTKAGSPGVQSRLPALLHITNGNNRDFKSIDAAFAGNKRAILDGRPIGIAAAGG